MQDTDIKIALNNWPEIVSKYQKNSTQKATIQIINSFGPFIAIWVLMYYSLNWSYWLTLGLAILNAFFLVRIFIIQHDCGHQAFLKSRKKLPLVFLLLGTIFFCTQVPAETLPHPMLRWQNPGIPAQVFFKLHSKFLYPLWILLDMLLSWFY